MVPVGLEVCQSRYDDACFMEQGRSSFVLHEFTVITQPSVGFTLASSPGTRNSNARPTPHG